MSEIGKKSTFSEVSRARIVNLKEEGCSECQVSVKIDCSKPVAHTAMNYFTKLGIYWDEEKTGRPRIRSAMDDCRMKFWFLGWLGLV